MELSNDNLRILYFTLKRDIQNLEQEMRVNLKIFYDTRLTAECRDYYKGLADDYSKKIKVLENILGKIICMGGFKDDEV